MKKMSDITSTKYYSQVKHPFYIIPYKYITDMQISKYVVNGDADEEEIYGDDYAVKAVRLRMRWIIYQSLKIRS